MPGRAAMDRVLVRTLTFRQRSEPSEHCRGRRKEWSGKRDSNPRPSAWKADALPLSYSRSSRWNEKKWWWGKDSNLRRLSRQIYSLFPLTAREPHHTRNLILADRRSQPAARHAGACPPRERPIRPGSSTPRGGGGPTLGFTFGRCWWGISKASIVSVGLHGEWRIRWRYDDFC